MDTSWVNNLSGKFIVFDGPDGCGKSTQARMFAGIAVGHDVSIFQTREPGGTSVGEDIRHILLDPNHPEITTQAEMLLFMAARAQLISEKIKPRLKLGNCVLSDRFVSSTMAYQGTAGKMPMLDIMAVSQVVMGDCAPDMTVIFDVDFETSSKRRGKNPDRIESKDRSYHEAVRSSYLGQAQLWPDRYKVINASNDVDAVFDDLKEFFKEWLS